MELIIPFQNSRSLDGLGNSRKHYAPGNHEPVIDTYRPSDGTARPSGGTLKLTALDEVFPDRVLKSPTSTRVVPEVVFLFLPLPVVLVSVLSRSTLARLD